MWFQNKMENFQALILLIFSNLHILIEWTVGRALAGISEGLLRLSGQEIFLGNWMRWFSIAEHTIQIPTQKVKSNKKIE